jgi:hypothetical protein
MRVLFATTRGAGHFGPLVPFAFACRRAGHGVVVVGPPSVAPLVARAGLSFLPVPEAPAATVDAAFAPVWSQTAAVDHVVQNLFVGLHARTALPGMRSIVAEWRPDVIVRESMEFASALAAEEHGVPQVRVGVHLASHIDGGGMLEAIAAPALDIAPERLLDSPLLTRAPASLNGPDEDVLRFRTDAAPPRPDHGEPLVYVSFGSEAPMSVHFPRVYRRAIDALAELPVRALVTIGDRRDPSELGPLPRSRPRWSRTAAPAPRSPRSRPACRRRSCRCSSTGRATPSGWRMPAPGSWSRTSRPTCARCSTTRATVGRRARSPPSSARCRRRTTPSR